MDRINITGRPGGGFPFAAPPAIQFLGPPLHPILWMNNRSTFWINGLPRIARPPHHTRKILVSSNLPKRHDACPDGTRLA
jgi:hypothetical protein